MATLKDISAELGLSVATVSRALNGFPEVSARTRARAAFVAHLQDLQAASGGLGQLHLNFDQEPGGKMLDLATIVQAAPTDAHFYACGPAPMLAAYQAAASAAVALGYTNVKHYAPGIDGWKKSGAKVEKS